MATRLVQMAMDARDDAALGRFWAEALGWSASVEEPGIVTNLEPEGFVYPDPVAVCVDVITVPEPKTVKNRVHIDLATTSAAHHADLVAHLKDRGATLADLDQGDVPWTVLADPEGNEFCVLTHSDAELRADVPLRHVIQYIVPGRERDRLGRRTKDQRAARRRCHRHRSRTRAHRPPAQPRAHRPRTAMRSTRPGTEAVAEVRWRTVRRSRRPAR